MLCDRDHDRARVDQILIYKLYCIEKQKTIGPVWYHTASKKATKTVHIPIEVSFLWKRFQHKCTSGRGRSTRWPLPMVVGGRSSLWTENKENTFLKINLSLLNPCGKTIRNWCPDSGLETCWKFNFVPGSVRLLQHLSP